jgi:hypothetical protein
MKRAVAAALVMFLAASAYGAVGDLAPKTCNPFQAGGWMVWMAGGQDVKPAPADCGTVSPKARTITLRGNGPPLLVAIDAAKADDKFLNVVRIDADGTGKFTAEASISFSWPAADGTGAADIGPATLTLVRDGRKVPVEVRGSAASNATGVVSLFLQFGSCLEGQCAFGDKVRGVRIVDVTGNFRMDDAAKVTVKDGTVRGITRGDAVQVDDGKGAFVPVGSVGQPVRVDGAWYDVAVSADGAQVSATALKGPFGKIKIDADKWTAMLIGPEHVFSLSGGNDPVEVPAGKYAVQMASVSKSGASMAISDSRLVEGKAEMFEVAADKTVENPFGSPLTARVEVAQNGHVAVLTPVILDCGGRQVMNVMAPAKPAAEFQVFVPNGAVAFAASLEFT